MINDDNIIVTIISFDDHEISKSEWNERSFAVGRNNGLSNIKELLLNIENNKEEEKHNNVIIIDDTMHLKSMRREIYTITRDNSSSTSFLIVSLKENISLETVLSRNASRPKETQVPEATVERLFHQFEFPGQPVAMSITGSKAKTLPWEKVVVSIDNSNEETMEAGLRLVVEHLPAARLQTHYLRNLHRTILNSKNIQARDGGDNRMGVVHMIDIAMRMEISRRIQLLPREERRSIAPCFAAAKQHTLKQAKASMSSSDRDTSCDDEDASDECIIAAWLEFFRDSLNFSHDCPGMLEYKPNTNET